MMHKVSIAPQNEPILHDCMKETSRLMSREFTGVDDYLEWVLNRWFNNRHKEFVEKNVKVK